VTGFVKATSNSARPFPRTGEIAIFANFTKSTGNFPPFFFCLFNLLRMVRLLHLELLKERYETDDSIMFSDLRKELTNNAQYHPWSTTKLALC
jgi:hypothetical protein